MDNPDADKQLKAMVQDELLALRTHHKIPLAFKIEEKFPEVKGLVVCSEHDFYCGGSSLQVKEPTEIAATIEFVRCPVCGDLQQVTYLGLIIYHTSAATWKWAEKMGLGDG